MPETTALPTGTENNVLKISKSFYEACERETRLIDASIMLSLAISIISPPDCSKEDDPTSTDITFDVRCGLERILLQAKEALEENIEAFCRCHEEQKYDEEGEVVNQDTNSRREVKS